MKPFSFIPVTLLLTSFLFLSCKKSSVHAKSNIELITQSSWKFDNAKVGGSDVSSLLQDCEKDNILFFVSDGTGTLDEGATKCDSTAAQTDPFTWDFANHDSVLHVSTIFFTGGSSDFNILTLSEAQLILSQDINFSGSMQNAVVSFKH